MRRGWPTVPLWWHPRSFDRLRSSGSRLHWAGWDEMDAARKRSRRRLSRPTAVGPGLLPTTAGKATGPAGAGTGPAGAGTGPAGAGTGRMGVGGWGLMGGRFEGFEGWRRGGGMSLLTAKRVRSGERNRRGVLGVIGVVRAWSWWPRTRWWWLPFYCGFPRPQAELSLRRDARRPRRIASRALVAGRTERRIVANPPKRLLIRSSMAGGGLGSEKLAGWGSVRRLASPASVTATCRELVVPCLQFPQNTSSSATGSWHRPHISLMRAPISLLPLSSLFLAARNYFTVAGSGKPDLVDL